MRRIMEGCPFFSSVEFAPMVRTLYIIHPEKGNWNQLIPDSDGNSDSSWQKDTVMDFYPAQAGRVPGSTCSLSCSSVLSFGVSVVLKSGDCVWFDRNIDPGTRPSNNM